MYKQRIKQIATITILLGVVFVGFGNLYGPVLLYARRENTPLSLMELADIIRNIGNFFMIIAPVALMIVDWRNIFPVLKKVRKNRIYIVDKFRLLRCYISIIKLRI